MQNGHSTHCTRTLNPEGSSSGEGRVESTAAKRCQKCGRRWAEAHTRRPVQATSEALVANPAAGQTDFSTAVAQNPMGAPTQQGRLRGERRQRGGGSLERQPIAAEKPPIRNAREVGLNLQAASEAHAAIGSRDFRARATCPGGQGTVSRGNAKPATMASPAAGRNMELVLSIAPGCVGRLGHGSAAGLGEGTPAAGTAHSPRA